MKIAIIHYWLTGMRGGEKVLENICEIYPKADIYTNVYDRNNISDKINSHNVFTTFIDKLPFSKKIYKYYLPFMPIALKKINLKKYDLIISSESGPAKGIVKGKNAFHVCYCHSPMRYIWDMHNQYLSSLNIIAKNGLRLFKNYLKKWDINSSKNIDLIISNSNFISNRILHCWSKKSVIINPGINLNDFSISNDNKDYYLVLSELVEYKRVDLAINAFNINKKQLLIIGKGPLYNKLLNVSNKNIKFLGWQSEEMKSFYLKNCKALIFPGIEDFGIVPLECMASGRPVLAYKKGGVLDYLKEDVNGMFFNNQTVESLNSCINDFENKKNEFSPKLVQNSIKDFSTTIFKDKLYKVITSNYESYKDI